MEVGDQQLESISFFCEAKPLQLQPLLDKLNVELIDLEWWVYLFLVGSLFIIFLLLNYILKKVNEAKIEGRFIRMRQKKSATHSTQVQGPLIEMETVGRPLVLLSLPERTLPTPPGISLVFNQEENLKCDKRMKDLEDTYTIIKKSLSATKQEVQSLIKVTSLETHGSSSLGPDFSSIKRKESSKIQELNSINPGISLKDSIDKHPGKDKQIKDFEETCNIITNSLSGTKQEAQLINVQSHDAHGSSSLGPDFSGIRKQESSRIKVTNSIYPGISATDSKPDNSIDKPPDDSHPSDTIS